MKKPSPLAVVLAAVALFGVGVGIVAVARGGGGSAPGPVVATASTLTPPAAGRLRRDFFGIVAEDAFAHPGPYRDATLNQLARMGVGIVRQTFDWSAIQTAPGRYDFTAYDSFVGALAARHMTVLPVLLNPPRFLSSAPAVGAQPGTYPPRHYADLGTFAAVLVRRYGPHGSFWRANPELPKVPIRAWQVWNEPSLPAYWPTGPNPGQYTQLLAATASAIRKADPKAEIVTAGLPNSRLGIPFDTFVEGMYKAGAKADFDTLAIHPYARDADGVTGAVEDAHRIMNLNGDGGARIWVTELGWADKGPRSSFTVGPARQARLISTVLSQLVALRYQAHLRGIVYFGWRDGAPYAPAFKDFWGLHTGLLDLSGRPKPALSAFARSVGTLRRHG
ncbi:MAG TPA: glycosyl hydrolase [Thermoleophilaceae bacterium]